MINQIHNALVLTQQQETHLAGIVVNRRPAEWDKTNAIMTDIKGSILSQLDGFQKQKCCYCGLQLWETSRGEIDHIAPKGARPRAYPEFTFEKKNLVLSCEYCNGSSKKGQTDIVFRYNTNYSDCEFKIVHPYFDNPYSHYEWVNTRTQIQLRHKTWKGKYSILLFQLDTIGQANARGKQRIYEKKLNNIKVVKDLYDRFKRIIYFNS
ncbi:hypothetical protein L0U88_01620 [Flavihumibacter sp. RY-1]|uniref:HNH endonuclease n=1 Tax=Flavihumibacter fluminis TaxID=2909236 RepID=A0ABS9BCG0_9BACT|nr:hypothetical protein [Flavihumibacter fluminis]MCF1713324.1 hypothetical protein [Flavihumibacter fluminis]